MPAAGATTEDHNHGRSIATSGHGGSPTDQKTAATSDRKTAATSDLKTAATTHRKTAATTHRKAAATTHRKTVVATTAAPSEAIPTTAPLARGS